MSEKKEINSYRILVTGAKGMIGSRLIEHFLSLGYQVVGVDRVPEGNEKDEYTYIQVDLGDKAALDNALEGQELTHIIHLAALAHTEGVADLSWDQYYHINVVCAENIFSVAAERNIPILFSSTADVYGITNRLVNVNSKRHPIGNYARSKCIAEDALKSICANTPYTIMRFAPVYTSKIKRDIQKRYYLKYPYVAYRVGKGVEYEVLNIDTLIEAVSNWIKDARKQQVINVKDTKLMNTVNIIEEEKKAGRAKIVIWFPHWVMDLVYKFMKLIMPMGWMTYMLSKVVSPLRTE